MLKDKDFILEKIDLPKDDVVDTSNIISFALNVTKYYQNNHKKICLVMPSLYDSQNLYDILTNFIDKDEISLFVSDEIIRLNSSYQSKEMEFEKIRSLYKTIVDEPNILIVNQNGLLESINSKKLFLENTIHLVRNTEINRSEFIKTLVNSGYIQQRSVTQVSELAVRGMIIDVFSPNYSSPIRIEFFDDEIDDIRLFNVDKEVSFEYLKECTIVPCSLKLFDPATRVEKIKLVENETVSWLTQARNDFISALEVNLTGGYLPSNLSNLFPYFRDEETNIISYLDKYKVFAYDYPRLIDQVNYYYQENKKYFDELAIQKQALKDESQFNSLDFTVDSLLRTKKINILEEGNITTPPYTSRNVYESIQALNLYEKNGDRVIIILSDKSYDSYKAILVENKVSFNEGYDEKSSLCLINDEFNHGFYDKENKIVYLSNKDIYNINFVKSKFLSNFKQAKVIKKYDDLVFGDYVVHENHGIGQYQGITEMKGLEYLKIQYAEKQVLYVPLNQFKFIRKYCGREGYVPSLDTIDGSSWKKRKARIYSKISYMADQLLLLYSKRESEDGFAFSSDPYYENEFGKNFPFQLTKSQIECIEEVSKDMEKPHPMDRLIAGDVGFGKTEVAFRAAFKAILNGKQVAFLCPTTVLARQHYEVALTRFRGFDINICELTRFVKPKVLKQNLEDIAAGKIHLIIGTHKLLSNKITFKDLGLLIVDEEQRFGVVHKEKIKALVSNIDCLTLSATPIPRTLELSLINVRPLSLLNDPPLNRLPIKTYTVKKDPNLIKEVIYRELARKGQVYYLFNRVENIHLKQTELEKMFPEARIAIVHGQMDGNDIENVMDNFYEGNIDILLCTSIIESGLDVANANTIIVERADTFGLSQLYQIKGRVGRSDKLAYCYFLYDSYEAMTEDGRKRLNALKQFTELGSGFKIANQDLLIRGAGNILGQEQAGHIDTIGYETYNKLLKDVITQKKLLSNLGDSQKPIKNSLFEQTSKKFELSFTLDAIVPIDFTDEENRINIYRELGNITNVKDLFFFKRKLQDMYGKLPEELGNLLTKKEIEIHLSTPIFDEFKETLVGYQITMTNEFSSQRNIIKKLETDLEPLIENLRVSIVNKKLVFFLNRKQEYLSQLLYLVEILNKEDDNNEEEVSTEEDLGDTI